MVQTPGHEGGSQATNRPAGEAKSPYLQTAEQARDSIDLRSAYLVGAGKDPQGEFFTRSSLDLLHGVELRQTCPFQRVIIGLIDAPAIQRLREVSQLSAAWMVYPDAIHSRFTHVFGSASLTAEVLTHLHRGASPELKQELELWGPITVAFALMHDLGHCAPGSHLAQRVFFPDEPDCHEEITHRIFGDDLGLRERLVAVMGPEAPEMLIRVARESHDVPRWTYQLVTGGGWNTDRGDWVPRDSHHCGVTYGFCDPKIIVRNLKILPSGELVIREGGVSALESFFESRTHMYRDVYNHPVSRIGESMHELLFKRVREVYAQGGLVFADRNMQAVLGASGFDELSLATIMNMTEARWKYHVLEWANGPDPIVSDLACRLMQRKLFKKSDATPENRRRLHERVEALRLDPQYYFVELPPKSVRVGKDLSGAMRVLRKDGTVEPLTTYSRTLGATSSLGEIAIPGVIAAPEECFEPPQIH